MNSFNYIKAIGIHVLIGFGVYSFPVLSKVYLIAIIIYFSYKVFAVKHALRTVQILFACSYIVGSEVFMRMTGGHFLYETSKYLVIIFCLIGLFTAKPNRQPISYITYIFLLVPGILIAGLNITANTTIRTAIAFNLSGPFCLGIVALFLYKMKISYRNFHKLFLLMVLPLITMTTYLFLYTPSIKDLITGTGSNFAVSGGFGPNQVATVLGLGMFIFSIRFFMRSPSLFLKIVNGSILAAISYRGIITFSRGGVLTALFMIATFIMLYIRKVNLKSKLRISKLLFVFVGIGMLIWLYSALQTNGFIEKRYANQDALGREKQDITTGRNDLVSFELEEFFKHPILGVGVGKIKELREEKEGVIAASHNEMSRILAEHGMFGVLAFVILIITPLILRLNNKSNVFFYSCYLFWFLTINHSSMRIAAPAFLYGLCLLDIVYKSPKTKPKKIPR